MVASLAMVGLYQRIFLDTMMIILPFGVSTVASASSTEFPLVAWCYVLQCLPLPTAVVLCW